MDDESKHTDEHTDTELCYQTVVCLKFDLWAIEMNQIGDL